MSNRDKYTKMVEEALYNKKAGKDPIREQADRLIEQGKLDEAIAVITEKGMKSFADFISFSMEEKIEKAVEKAVAKITVSMMDAMSNMLEVKMAEIEMPEYSEEEYNKSIDEISAHKEMVEEVKEPDKGIQVVAGSKLFKTHEDLIRDIFSKPINYVEFIEEFNRRTGLTLKEGVTAAKLLVYFQRLGWEVSTTDGVGVNKFIKLL